MSKEELEIVEAKLDNIYKWIITIKEEIDLLRKILKVDEKVKKADSIVSALNEAKEADKKKYDDDFEYDFDSDDRWEDITKLLPKEIEPAKRKLFKDFCNSQGDNLKYCFYGKKFKWYIRGDPELVEKAKELLS